MAGRKLIIEIPEWADEKNLYVFAGIEMLAYQYAGHPLMMKTGRCNQCGECCKHLRSSRIPNNDGICTNLTEQNTCGLAIRRPFACGFPQKSKDIECTETYAEAESDTVL